MNTTAPHLFIFFVCLCRHTRNMWEKSRQIHWPKKKCKKKSIQSRKKNSALLCVLMHRWALIRVHSYIMHINVERISEQTTEKKSTHTHSRRAKSDCTFHQSIDQINILEQVLLCLTGLAATEKEFLTWFAHLGETGMPHWATATTTTTIATTVTITQWHQNATAVHWHCQWK